MIRLVPRHGCVLLLKVRFLAFGALRGFWARAYGVVKDKFKVLCSALVAAVFGKWCSVLGRPPDLASRKQQRKKERKCMERKAKALGDARHDPATVVTEDSIYVQHFRVVQRSCAHMGVPLPAGGQVALGSSRSGSRQRMGLSSCTIVPCSCTIFSSSSSAILKRTALHRVNFACGLLVRSCAVHMLRWFVLLPWRMEGASVSPAYCPVQQRKAELGGMHSSCQLYS